MKFWMTTDELDQRQSPDYIVMSVYVLSGHTILAYVVLDQIHGRVYCKTTLSGTSDFQYETEYSGDESVIRVQGYVNNWFKLNRPN